MPQGEGLGVAVARNRWLGGSRERVVCGCRRRCLTHQWSDIFTCFWVFVGQILSGGEKEFGDLSGSRWVALSGTGWGFSTGQSYPAESETLQVAIMIPGDPPRGGAGQVAEAEVYRALQRGLPDAFYVYHHTPFVDPSNAGEGEADFLVLHREHGLLLIECKGSGIARQSHGGWVRKFQGRETPIRSPFDQAQDSVHKLARILFQRGRDIWPSTARALPMTFGHAVAFPYWNASTSPLPLESPRAMVFDAVDLGDMGARVVEAMQFWCKGQPAQPLSERAFRLFREEVLHPELNIVHSLGARLEVDGLRFARLTEEHVLALQGLSASPRLSIEGGAGSGKTALALEMARKLAGEGGGRQVLLLCFNRFLAAHLSRTVAEWDLPAGSVVARHFHGLCQDAADALGVKPEFPPEGAGDDQTRFWNVTFPLVLMEAWADGGLPRWDAILVDEAQDFADGWWEILDEGLADKERSHFAIFHDAAQNIFGRQAVLPEMPVRFPLTYNLRNTQKISAVVSRLSTLPLKPHPRCPEGEEPVVYAQEGSRKTLAQLNTLIRKLLDDGVAPERIAILTPHSRKNSTLADIDEIAGLPLTEKGEDRAGSLLHTTIGKFKGLECDVGILLDIHLDDPRCNRNARYVAVSRARQRLFVFARGDWLE